MSLSGKLSVLDVPIQDKRILVRVDFNVPLENGRVANSTRIAASLATIRYLLDFGAQKVILISHLGRPDGEKTDKLSLKPVAEELQKILLQPVRFIDECVGPRVEEECRTCEERVVVLENLRFHVEEEGKCERKDGSKVEASSEDIAKFRANLSKLGDLYVNDAFGTVHRAHSSIAGINLDTRVAGLLVKKELDFFSKALEGPEKLYALILGGAKVSDKIQLIENMLPKVENIIIGGGMVYTFMKVLHGMKIGKSLYDSSGEEVVKKVVHQAEAAGVKIHLPVDFIEAVAFNEDANYNVVKDEIQDEWMGLDVGPESANIFSKLIRDAPPNRVILWNGPMGVFEWDSFAAGTTAILSAMVEATQSGAITIVGGGDSAAAVTKWNCEDKLCHVSTGGGASLELLEGKLVL